MDPHATRGESTASDTSQPFAGLGDSEPDHSPLGHIRIGRYQLKDELGGGGMGTVYRAVQDQPRRMVALKLMRSGIRSRSARHRFEYESQLLARLRHPGIAQVYDAGTHRQGDHDVPWYVMELIPGAKPITDYANQKKLGIRERLELFAQVCDAVHHAHTKGIIHRDIKPQNILIDSNGQPKVIDFGVARAIDSDMAPVTAQTEVSQLLGTLQYMSPEQLELDSSELDARSDVYSLGVVLYELVCGRLPYEVSRANVAEATRVIQTHAPKLPRALRPDLDVDTETVLLEAIHKDRGRRYRNASALAADIRQILADEPIGARRDSATYVFRTRARRLLSRHQILSPIGAWLIILLFVEIVVGSIHHRIGGQGWMHRWMTATVPVRRVTSLDNVRIIALKAEPSVETLADRQGLKGVTTEDRPSVRRMHGLLLTKLADSGARVIGFDISFVDPSPFDADLLRGVEAISAKGIPSVVVQPSWKLSASGEPHITPALRGRVRWGGASAQLEPNRPWSLDLLCRRGKHEPIPSLALAIAAAYWHPTANPAFVLDWYSDAAYIMFEGSGRGTTERRVPLTTAEQRAVDDPQLGIEPHDVIGSFFIGTVDREVLDASTVSYERVLSASGSELRQWFEGKAILIGDQRPGRDRVVQTGEGESVFGFEIHAIGLDALIAEAGIRPPKLVKVLGAHVHAGYLADAAGAAVAAAIGILLARAPWRRLGATLLLSICAIVISILVYARWRTLHDPVVLIVLIILSAEVVAYAVRTGRTVSR